MKPNSGYQMLNLPANIMGTASVIHPTVLWDQGQAILVDAGYPGQLDQIRAAMEQAGVPFDQIRQVILTHHDIDHIGGLSAILKALPGQVKVLAHETEIDYINGQKRPLKLAQLEANLEHLPEEMKKVYQALNAGFQNSRVDVDQALRDGEVLPDCGGIQVIATPGHTLGHICLYLQQSKTLIAGDALEILDGQLALSPAFTNYDNELCRRSLEKLGNYEIERVICYHGGIFTANPNQAILSLHK